MPHVRLIHWNDAEAQACAQRIRLAGYEVAHAPISMALLRGLKDNLPAAVVIDLSRLPMQGRDVALAIRHTKSTRSVPLVFVDGADEKIVRVREQLPDAVYTKWDRIGAALEEAISNPPANPKVPESMLAGYSGAPLVKKLGIKPNMIVALIGAPANFEAMLGELPENVKLTRRRSEKAILTIWFIRKKQELEQQIARMVTQVGEGGVWIVWPKKAAGKNSDLTQAVVRKIGLASGLVDYKICAIDETWSGLKFTKRK